MVNVAALGAIVSAAVYLFGLVFAGVMLGHTDVAVVAIVAAGASYLSYFAQFHHVGRVPETLMTVVSNLFGVLAGCALLAHIA